MIVMEETDRYKISTKKGIDSVIAVTPEIVMAKTKTVTHVAILFPDTIPFLCLQTILYDPPS